MSSITEFRGEYRWLSNFVGSFITRSGTACKTVEHGFQAAKSIDPQEQEQVLACTTPGRAKRAGRHVRLRMDWEDIKDRVMLQMVRWKFQQNPALAAKLLDTGDATLIEGNVWHDNYWGDCHCGRAKCTTPGKNMLGTILMNVRAELRGH